MNFGEQPFKYANSDRIESTDPQFLTFRTNANQISGRSIYSQNMEMYESGNKLDFDSQEIENTPPARSFKKKNPLRSIKSQERLQARTYIPIKKALNFDQYQDENQEQEESEFEHRNQVLRKKQKKLTKCIKIQGERQEALEKQIELLEQEIEQNQVQIQQKQTEVEEYSTILEDNEQYLYKLLLKSQEATEQNQQLSGKNQNTQELLERSQQLSSSSRHQEPDLDLANRMKEGLKNLKAWKEEITKRSSKIQDEIENMKDYLQMTENIDLSIRDISLASIKADYSNGNSHFTC